MLFDFWYRLKTYLEPLARAENISQAAFCWLDQVLLTFESLCMHFNNLKVKDSADIPGRLDLTPSLIILKRNAN